MELIQSQVKPWCWYSIGTIRNCLDVTCFSLSLLSCASRAHCPPSILFALTSLAIPFSLSLNVEFILRMEMNIPREEQLQQQSYFQAVLQFRNSTVKIEKLNVFLFVPMAFSFALVRTQLFKSIRIFQPHFAFNALNVLLHGKYSSHWENWTQRGWCGTRICPIDDTLNVFIFVYVPVSCCFWRLTFSPPTSCIQTYNQ